jgi:hypothetical protein
MITNISKEGGAGLGAKWATGIPFQEYIIGRGFAPQPKAQYMLFPMVEESSTTNSLELSSTKKKRVLKMKKHKYRKRLKENRRQRKENK